MLYIVIIVTILQQTVENNVYSSTLVTVTTKHADFMQCRHRGFFLYVNVNRSSQVKVYDHIEVS